MFTRFSTYLFLILFTINAFGEANTCPHLKDSISQLEAEISKFDAGIKQQINNFSTELASFSNDLSAQVLAILGDEDSNYLDRDKVSSRVSTIKESVQEDLTNAIKDRNAYDRYVYYFQCTVLTPVISLMAADEGNFSEEVLNENVLNNEMIYVDDTPLFKSKGLILSGCIAAFPLLGYLFDKVNKTELLFKRDVEQVIKQAKKTNGKFRPHQVLLSYLRRNPGKVIGGVTLSSALFVSAPLYYFALLDKREDVEEEQQEVKEIQSTIDEHMNSIKRFFSDYYYHLDLLEVQKTHFQKTCINPAI